MQISTRHGFAFLCTPKCASTSISSAIKGLCNIDFYGHPELKHINARVYQEHIIPLQKHLFPTVQIESFCIIREPMERMQSWYRYRARKNLQNPSHRNHKNYTGNISYNDFIESYLTGNRKTPRSQYEFMRLENGQIGVDYIFPLERMDLVSDFILKKTGVRISLPHKNSSPRKKWDLTLDNELEKRLRAHLRDDIELYDFVKKHKTFNKALHAEELSGSL